MSSISKTKDKIRVKAFHEIPQHTLVMTKSRDSSASGIRSKKIIESIRPAAKPCDTIRYRPVREERSSSQSISSQKKEGRRVVTVCSTTYSEHAKLLEIQVGKYHNHQPAYRSSYRSYVRQYQRAHSRGEHCSQSLFLLLSKKNKNEKDTNKSYGDSNAQLVRAASLLFPSSHKHSWLETGSNCE